MTIYRLQTASDSPAHEAEEWLRGTAPTLGRCAGCGLFRTARAIDVPVEGKLDDSALNFFWSTGVGIAHVKLLDALGREVVFEGLRMGYVLDHAGRQVPEFRTFQPVRTAFIRGGRTSKVRRCEVCHSILYAPVKAHHLVGQEQQFRGLLGTNLSGTLILDEGIANRLGSSRFKNVEISDVRVFEEPIDGYPADLEELV